MTAHRKINTRQLKLLYPITFMGGPFDGHIQQFRVSPQYLPQDLMCPVRRSDSGLLAAKGENPQSFISSIALYELSFQGEHWNYQFVGLMPPTVYSGRYTTANGDFHS
ncbi:MAG: hypothetical protein KF752_19630 [Pirellulaceae bacterium]|nr:hypothetical protein [Pirellulaceae bacterium]